MTSLERPLPLPVVVAGLILVSIGGFALGVTNALKAGGPSARASTAPLAEVSGVAVKDAAPAPLYVPTPPEKPKPKVVEEALAEEAEAPPVIEAPPVAPEGPAEKKPETPPPAPPTRIEDLY